MPSQQRIFLPSLCPWCLCGELFRHFHHEGTKGTKKTRPAGRWRYGERPFFVPQASRRPRPHPILCILCIHVKIPASGAFQTRCSQPSGPWPVCLRPVMLFVPQPFPSFPRKREPILGQRIAPRVEGMDPRFRGGDGRGVPVNAWLPPFRWRFLEGPLRRNEQGWTGILLPCFRHVFLRAFFVSLVPSW